MNRTAVFARRAALFGLVVAIVAALLLLMAGPGYRVDLWHFHASFTLMRWAAYLGIAAAVVSGLAAGLSWRCGLPVFSSLIALVLGVAGAWVPWQILQSAKSLPPIHDISTDTNNPPQFAAVVALRGADSNPLEYGGAGLAAQQQSAYPDIRPLTLPLAPNQAWDRALAAADNMDWKIVATDQAAGRIEATATTYWFGFKDDVVVRIGMADEGRSRIDVRSVSRVGKSDVGANAQRIRAYLALLQSL